MDGVVEEGFDQQPSPECSSIDACHIAKESTQIEVIPIHVPDAEHATSKPDGTDSEPPCVTPMTTSSEDMDENSADAKSTACLKDDGRPGTDIASLADTQSLFQASTEESIRSCEQSSQHPHDAGAKLELQSVIRTSDVEKEVKDVVAEELEPQAAVDAENEDQIKPGSDEDETKSSDNDNHNENKGEDENKPKNDESEVKSGNDEDQTRTNASDDKVFPREEADQKNSENEDQMKAESEFQEVEPAEILLPDSPYFNPFESRTSSHCSSFDDISPLDDSPEQSEPPVESVATRVWIRQKENFGGKNKALDDLMEMVGLESAKMTFLEIKAMIDGPRSRKSRLRRHLNLVLIGNPGTGKAFSYLVYYKHYRSFTEIVFSPMDSEAALRHLCNLMAKQDIELLDAEGGSGVMENEVMMSLYDKLAKTKGWSNGRDMQTLAGVVTEHVYGNMMSFGQGQGGGLCITRKELIRLMMDMLHQRTKSEIREED